VQGYELTDLPGKPDEKKDAAAFRRNFRCNQVNAPGSASMTTEQNQPQAQPPQGQAPQGQPQGHRRRRRRRKGAKGQPNAPQANGQANQQNQPPQGQKPKYSNQGRQYQKNGSGGGQGGGRRKNKQRRQQVFVGPMDHSYRVANGNIADGPPSTIEYRNGNGNPNGYHPTEAVVETPPVPVREDAPTRIFCFIDDLFFLAKIQETARKLGVKVGFVKADKDIVTKLSNVPEDAKPSLIVFDLNNANAKPLTLIPKLKTKLKRGTSIIGFLSHLQGDLKVKALEAGCDMVMPRSAFSQNLPNLLRRHGLDEELEAVEA
jgi:CheY-like chemotaxis protein